MVAVAVVAVADLAAAAGSAAAAALVAGLAAVGRLRKFDLFFWLAAKHRYVDDFEPLKRPISSWHLLHLKLY